MNIIIVGGGLFGSIAAEALGDAGHEVLVINNFSPSAGSKPAACLMKPGWFSGLDPDEVRIGLDLLDRLYNLQTIKFSFNIGKVDVHWVPPSRVLAPKFCDHRAAEVKDVEPGRVTLRNGEELEADVIIVAAGVWTQRLLPMIPVIKPLAGIAYTFDGVRPPSISVWAPYKQLVMFSREQGMTWVGDGSAILSKNWNKARQDCILNRCQKAFGERVDPLKSEFGLRPYMDGYKGGYLKEVMDGVWANTGGAKNGTIIAAIHATRLLSILGPA